MKLRIILLSLLLIIPIATAQIDLQKVSYDISETIQAELKIDDLAEDIKLENIQITDMQANKQAIQINLIKIKDNHYSLFFEMNNQGNYFLNIKDIKYREYGILKQISLTKAFEITNQIKDISIDPAIFKYESGLKTFNLKIKNNQQQAKVVLLSSNYTSLEFQNSIPIAGRTEQTITIKLKEETEEKIELKIDDYVIPIYIPPTKKISTIDISLNNQIITKLIKDIEDKTTTQGTLEIKNNFNEIKQFDIKLTGDLSEILRINKNKITIDSNNEQTLELYINEQKNPQQESYKGNLEFTTQNYRKTLPVELTITKEVIQVEQTTIEEEPEEEFSETENIKQEEPPAEIPEKPRTGLVIAIVLIMILILVIFFVVRKPIKHTKPKYLRNK